MLNGGQKGLSELLQAYTLCIGQNGHCDPLQASYGFWGGQNRLSEPLQYLYTIYLDLSESLHAS